MASYYQDSRTAPRLTPDAGISGCALGKGAIIPPARTKRCSQYPPPRGAMKVLLRCRLWRFTLPTGDFGTQWIAPAFASPKKVLRVHPAQNRTGDHGACSHAACPYIRQQRENSTDIDYERHKTTVFQDAVKETKYPFNNQL